MTSINENNIEKWLFDYHEGNLNQEEIEALEKYIMMNPALEPEMDAWSKAYVEDESFVYDNADSLVKEKRKIGWIGWSSAATLLISGTILSFLFLKDTEKQLQFSAVQINDTSSDLPISETSSKQSTLPSFNKSHSIDQKTSNLVSKQADHNSSSITDQTTDLSGDDDFASKNIQYNNVKRMVQATLITPNKKNSNTNTNAPITHFNTKENLVAATANKKTLTQTSKKKEQITNSNVQIHSSVEGAVADNRLDQNSNTTTLISDIPGNADQGTDVDEFAHLEPVKVHFEKDIILDQALDKLDFESDKNYASYENNPNYSETPVNLSNNLKNSSSRKTSSKFIRDIKRAFNNTAGVTNLRDPNLIIPGYNAISFNPALVGSTLNTRIQGSYFNQWTGTEAMQHVTKLSIDSYVYGMRGGVGLDITYRNYGNGMYQNYEGALSYSPKINFGNYLSVEPALKFKMGAYTLNHDKIIPGGQIEIERGNLYQTFNDGEQPIGTTKIYYDLGLGLFVNTKWFYGGFSIDNMFRHKENIYSNSLSDQRRAPLAINAVIGTDFESSDKNFTGSPFIVYQHYDTFDEFYFGSNFRVYWGTMGVSVSDKGNLSAQAGIQFKNFKMLYQYDWTKSKLLETKGHSHQLMFRFSMKTKRTLSKNLEY